MVNCCVDDSGAQRPPKKARCPRNGQRYASVGLQTVTHHVRKPWAHRIAEQAYYFCDDPDCEVVYFAADESFFTRADVRDSVAQKSRADERKICYCFDIATSDLQSAEALTRLKAFVIEQTRQSLCSCEIKNPSGRCCLGDFPKCFHATSSLL